MTYGEVGMTEELKLTIFTCKWGKCVNPMGEYLLESLTIFSFKN